MGNLNRFCYHYLLSQGGSNGYKTISKGQPSDGRRFHKSPVVEMQAYKLSGRGLSSAE